MTTGESSVTTSRWLRLIGIMLVGVASLWLAFAALTYSAGNSAGDVAVPTEDDFWGYDYLARWPRP